MGITLTDNHWMHFCYCINPNKTRFETGPHCPSRTSMQHAYRRLINTAIKRPNSAIEFPYRGKKSHFAEKQSTPPLADWMVGLRLLKKLGFMTRYPLQQLTFIINARGHKISVSSALVNQPELPHILTRQSRSRELVPSIGLSTRQYSLLHAGYYAIVNAEGLCQLY